jgi:sulfofructosephosphate aldolase
MALDQSTRVQRYRAISTERGAFAMVAMDQRESLRTMLEDISHESVPDSALVTFKLDVVEALSPTASALLIDTQWGLEPMLDAHALDSACGLIVAADALVQTPGQPVTDTTLDTSIDPHRMAKIGASALKLLVIWRPDADSEKRQGLVRNFVDLCHSAGLLALVEPVVRAPASDGGQWDREESILEAAREIGPLGVDVYKAEVPLYGRGVPAEITERCRALTLVLPCPWVVLSQGVAVEDFPRAVEAACRGGASGFLAGRAVWSDTLSARDQRAEIERVSVPRLTALRETVDRLARPWNEVIGD